MRKALACLASAALVAIISQDASAVVIAGGDGTGNVTAPSGLTQWNNVALVNGSTGVYVGNGWMLTAYHVGVGTATFPDNSVYSPDGTSVRLHNPDNSLTDLLMFHLSTVPVGLSALTIASSTPATNTSVYMIGNGRNREATLTQWDVNTATNPDTWTVSTSPPSDASGYLYAAGNSLRWGTNTIDGTNLVDAGFGTVHALRADFSNVAGEGQLVDNDSGGAMFLTNGTLAGTLDARGIYDGQPTNSAVFGNLSYAADLSVYRSEIMSTVPEPSMIMAAVTVGMAVIIRRRRPE